MSESRRSPPPTMTPERWAKLEPLVDAALDLSPGERQAYVEQVKTGDTMLGAELEYLIEQVDRDDSLIDRAQAERSVLLDPPPDTQAKLQAALGTAYTIERELGGGGMSRVFVAREHGLGRAVVIKVLAEELAAGISTTRFEREIKLAASLQQANIVPLLAAGNAGGVPYYTMPLVEGRSLRERLAREGALPIGDAVSVLRDIARALAYAHERGVVHRDIKPGNVLLSGRTAVVTDFGIAKAIGASRTSADRDAALTQTGAGIGTPAYMAPEQAAGDPNTDHRADIYAFGCVAYELFTGLPPFHGQESHRIIAAHFQETPRPATEKRPEIPPAIAALIARCLEKDPARRPQDASDLLYALDSMATSQPVIAARRRPSRVTLGAVGFTTIVIVAATLFALRRGREAAQPIAIGVVPFFNVAKDTALDYRADGVSDEILTALGRVPGIQITGRSAAYRYKGQRAVDVNDAERVLGVRFLITGTLQKVRGRLIVSAQLNDSVTHGELWAGAFERDTTALSSVSDDIAHTVTDTLRARFSSRFGKPRRDTSAVGTTNSAALDLYLVGQEHLKRRRIPQGIAAFEQAINFDPNFARAWAALAKGLLFVPFNGTPPVAIGDSTIAAATKALAIDTTLADAHTALASAYSLAGRWVAAEGEFQHALALEPDNFEAHFTYARGLTMRGDFAGAATQFEQARRLERVSALVSAWTSYLFYLNGQIDSALVESARAFELDSTLGATTSWGLWVNVATGHADIARRMVAAPAVRGTFVAPYAYAKLGDTATAWALVRSAEARVPRAWVGDVQRASVALAIGDTAAALEALEKSQAAYGLIWSWFLPARDPIFDPVRKSARFAALVNAAGLDVRLMTSPRAGRPRPRG